MQTSATITTQSTSKGKLQQGFLSLLEGPTHDVREISEYLTIGRDEGNLFPVNDPEASNRHARIEWRHEGYILKDLRSRQGTWLNGIRILEAPLYHNDRVRIGHTDLIFRHERDKRPLSLMLTSKNTNWNKKLRELPDLSRTDLPVLLGGPSGTGKEILAQMIHQHSGRREGPFVSVNCSAMTESLAESELFGHVKGSFTDATHDRKGAFEAARGGTLFLDEIGDLPINLQPKLLRALENREIRPVGADRTLSTDVRIVAASHHNLKERVIMGDFRADLFFRINVLHMKAPSLKNRLEDFENLLHHFAREYRVGFTIDAIDKLKAHRWPGNIRELKNVVARAKALCKDRVTALDVENLIDILPDDFGVGTAMSSLHLSGHMPSGNVIKDLERTLIEKRLIVNNGNQRRTAADLGLPKSTLHDRIKSYKIDISSLISQNQLN